jgi:nucleoid-associated protein YgaU
MLVKNAVVVTVLENAAPIALAAEGVKEWLTADDGSRASDQRWIQDAIGLEVRSMPFRTETRRTVNVPVRVAPAKGTLVTQTICLPRLRSSDELPRESCTLSTLYVVQPGDSLQAIAKSAYGDPNRWRGIAAVNGIRDPDKIQPGVPLLIP